MADQKITELTAIDAPIATDIFPMVDDPGGTPVTKKSTFQQLADLYASLTQTLTNKTLTSPKLNENVALTSTSTELNNLHSKTVNLDGWVEFTPTWTYVTPGSGSQSYGRYKQIGKLVYFHAKLVLGTSPTMGALTLAAPVTISTLYHDYTPLGLVTLNDSSTLWQAYWYNTVGYIGVQKITGSYIQHATVSSTVPFTWGAGDWVTVSACYEAA